MEFFEDAVEISEAEVDDQVIDDGLQLIRKMWDIGLSHRDIKPANLMVQDGRMRLIDVFFVQVRALAVAPGGRPGQHDARAGAALEPGVGL